MARLACPTFGRSPGPSLSIVNRDGTFDRSGSDLDHPADATRAGGLLGTRIEYIPHPSFDDPDARDAILGPMPGPAVARAPRRTEAPAGLPPYLASLYNAGPLLSREQEAHLFRKLNYLKCLAERARARLDRDEFELLYEEAMAVQHRIILANLRLVVSIARRYLGPHNDLFELVSDGNYGLIRAVERFDYSRGNKFSTYATWTIRNQFALAIRRKNRRRPQVLLGHDEVFKVAADPRTDELEQSDVQEQRQEAVARLLTRLDDRERRIIAGHYGIGGARELTLNQLGQELGISKERVRQLEARAQDKLRGLARTEELDLLLA